MSIRQTLPPLYSETATTLPAPVGVLLYDTSFEVDPIISAAISLMRAGGLNVGGLRQRFGHALPNGKRAMWLEDIQTGLTLRLDRPRGPGATSCILDPDALARAACLLRQSAENGAELVVLNRFGHAEAEGRGMRHEIAGIICAGTPMLIPVRYALLPDLEGFLGAQGHLLLPSAAAIAAWAAEAVRAALDEPVRA